MNNIPDLSHREGLFIIWRNNSSPGGTTENSPTVYCRDGYPGLSRSRRDSRKARHPFRIKIISRSCECARHRVFYFWKNPFLIFHFDSLWASCDCLIFSGRLSL
ncbi:Uncharacterized protein dnm_013510 [Desulfonema magnum]|uniref:Uncharacterized protein n=1 Tax=Desulfonema magnum TaxID=45655 RepID=A0A975GL07_9BACT|nr:Uncharacterized protein dnm_013510 [Desulfonema magnum]